MATSSGSHSQPGPEPQPDEAEPVGRETPLVLKTSGLSRSFGKVQALDGLDLTVREGEVYGFLGQNGAGKTTAIRIVMGIIKADSGTIELFGTSCSRITTSQKQWIGYVAQEQTFYAWMTCQTLGDFVSGFYPTWDKTEFKRLLQVLEIPPKRRVSHLSGGTRVKLALALALAHRPRLLILDEPTSGLDPVARRQFLDMILHQASKYRRTTFFSTHRIEEVERVADRVGIVHNGRLRYEGDVRALQESVRTVRLPAGAPPPPGVEILRHQTFETGQTLVVRGGPDTWNWPEAEVLSMSLEDIFIALVGAGVGDL